MKTARMITASQKSQLENEIYHDGMFFNPIEDNLGIWYISNEEVDLYDGELAWVKTLPEMPYVAKVIDLF